MSVYLDPLFVAVPSEPEAARCGSLWCHMIADTPEELHAMAEAIGLRREWFQRVSFPHYDLTPSRRARAVDLGALTLDRRTFVLKLREIRELQGEAVPA